MMPFWTRLFGPADPDEDVLARVPLFEDLRPRERRAVYRRMHRREVIAGETVFTQGEPGLGMYVVARGVVSIRQDSSGHELAELTDGDFFGEIALFNETIRTATARAKTDGVLLSLYQPELRTLLKRRPRTGVRVLLALARLLGQRLAAANAATDLPVRREHVHTPDGA